MPPTPQTTDCSSPQCSKLFPFTYYCYYNYSDNTGLWVDALELLGELRDASAYGEVKEAVADHDLKAANDGGIDLE